MSSFSWRRLSAAPLLLLLGACSTIGLPATVGERAASYGYVPLDPLAVSTNLESGHCQEQGQAPSPLLEALPDLAIRFAVADVDAGGSLTFGPSKLTTSGGAYRAVLDYVNVDVVPVDFDVRKRVAIGGGSTWVALSQPLPPEGAVTAYEARVSGPLQLAEPDRVAGYERVTIPVYVGVGLRLSADIRALKSNVNLSGLGAIGASAEADALSGTLTVQTLGINGSAIAMALPLPNKLDQTTIESAILALGTSRATLYNTGADASGPRQAFATPRVVALYSPFGSDARLINAMYSALSREPPIWRVPCRKPKLIPARSGELTVVLPPKPGQSNPSGAGVSGSE